MWIVLSSNTTSNNEIFKEKLKESIKTFLTMVILIFVIVFGFMTLAIIFPAKYEVEAFVFAYIVAIPFMFMMSLYPFAK